MASVNQTANTAPIIAITPSSPTTSSPSTTTTPVQPESTTIPPTQTVMKEKVPTDSETALLTQQPGGQSSQESKTDKSLPVGNSQRESSKKGDEVEVVQPIKPGQDTSTSTNPPTTKSISQSTPNASTSTSKPIQLSNPSRPVSKKKKKRKGLAGLLVALGCLSAGSIDDDEPKSRKDMAQKPTTKPATSTSTPVTRPVSSTPVVDTKGAKIDATEPATATATAGTTLTDDTNAVIDGPALTRTEDVVVAPVEPKTSPIDETAGVTSSAVQPPGSGSELLTTPSRPHAVRRESDTSSAHQGTPVRDSDGSKEKTDTTSGGYTDISDSDIRTSDENQPPVAGDVEYGLEEEYEDEEDRLIAQGGMGIPLDEYGRPAPLLPPLGKDHIGRKCLVLDLDETLLHSSFKMLPTADYIVPVEIESQSHNVYVIKRPGVDHFLTEMGKIYEVVIFTASLSKYADPVLDMLDPARVVRHRLFRESCYNHKGNYVKDLSQLGRDMEGCIILDNSPASYIFHPNNAVPVSTWFNDPHDTELTDLCPFLVDLAGVDDIRGVLEGTL